MSPETIKHRIDIAEFIEDLADEKFYKHGPETDTAFVLRSIAKLIRKETEVEPKQVTLRKLNAYLIEDYTK